MYYQVNYTIITIYLNHSAYLQDDIIGPTAGRKRWTGFPFIRQKRLTPCQNNGIVPALFQVKTESIMFCSSKSPISNL